MTPQIFFCPPKSALERALDVGAGGVTPKKLFLCPLKSALEGALDVGSGGATLKMFFFAPPNPRSRAPWTLDRGCDPQNIFFCAPKSALEGALDAGCGNATQKLKKISAQRRSDVGMIIRRAEIMLRPRVRAGGCPGGWISEAQPDSSAQIRA